MLENIVDIPKMQELITSCWKQEAEERPDATRVRNVLEQITGQREGYISYNPLRWVYTPYETLYVLIMNIRHLADYFRWFVGGYDNNGVRWQAGCYWRWKTKIIAWTITDQVDNRTYELRGATASMLQVDYMLYILSRPSFISMVDTSSHWILP